MKNLAETHSIFVGGLGPLCGIFPVAALPAPIADIAYQNNTVIYHLLFNASAEETFERVRGLLPCVPHLLKEIAR